MDLRNEVWKRIDEVASEAWSLSLRIHSHPELAWGEVQAAKWISEKLDDAGYSVQRGIGQFPTAFRATHPDRSGGPSIALVAEYDALPEIGHSCGHNLIAGIAIGSALGLAPFKKLLPGTLCVLGTPAEEEGGGKIALLDAGIFREVDAALMIHPGHQTWASRGYLAMSEVDVSFRGVAAHALSNPEKGASALDALLQTFSSVDALRKHLRSDGRIHGVITRGGGKPGVVPEDAAARFLLAATTNDYRDYLAQRLRLCSEGAALATGTYCTVESVGPEYKTMLINRPLASRFERYAEMLGFPSEVPDDGMASTDMANVSWEVPSLHPHLAVTGRGIPVHDARFADEARSDTAREAMLAGSKVLAAICLDLWQEADFYQAVREDFARGRIGNATSSGKARSGTAAAAKPLAGG
jgi:amidohydrolase